MDEMAVRRMEVPNAVLLGQVKEAIREGHTATINVKGYSMRPFLEHCRDKVRLASFTDLKVGDAVLAEFSPDKYVLHRIIEIDGDVVVMMGDGNLRHKEICCKEDIVGIVTHYIRRGKTVPGARPHRHPTHACNVACGCGTSFCLCAVICYTYIGLILNYQIG